MYSCVLTINFILSTNRFMIFTADAKPKIKPFIILAVLRRSV